MKVISVNYPKNDADIQNIEDLVNKYNENLAEGVQRLMTEITCTSYVFTIH